FRRSVRSASLDGTDSEGRMSKSSAARSRPHAAESLNDWSPRPVRSNNRPTFWPSSLPATGPSGHDSVEPPPSPDEVSVSSSSPHAAAKSDSDNNMATNNSSRLRMDSLQSRLTGNRAVAATEATRTWSRQLGRPPRRVIRSTYSAETTRAANVPLQVR